MKHLFVGVSVAMLVSACGGNNESYEVSDANCAPNHYASLPADVKRDALVEACMTRSPGATGLPEVNDANCETEAINKISSMEARKKFAGLCVWRGAEKS